MARQAGRVAQAVHGEPLCLLRAASHWPHPRARGPAFTLTRAHEQALAIIQTANSQPQVPDTCFRPASLLAAAPRVLYAPRLPRTVETSLMRTPVVLLLAAAVLAAQPVAAVREGEWHRWRRGWSWCPESCAPFSLTCGSHWREACEAVKPQPRCGCPRSSAGSRPSRRP